RVVMAVGFFFLIGAYWLITGEKFDETAYRLVLCPMYAFERCSSPSVSSSQPETDRGSLEILRRNEARREQQLKDAADAIARLEAAQREQAKRSAPTSSPELPASATQKKRLCMNFNGQTVCE